ncbi:hypothetical protein ACXZ66_03965 [Corynebacterium sp. S7]
MSPTPPTYNPPRLVLASGVNIILRDATHIQFGLDATRTGVLESPLAPELAELLHTLSTPIARPLAAEEFAVRTGADRAEIESLFDELLSYKVLIPPNGRTVYLVGSSPLAVEISGQLHDLGFRVRRPTRGETDNAFLAQIDPANPVLLVDRLAHSRSLAPALTRLAPNAVPVTIFDHRALVGPARIAGHGPCLLCLQLGLTKIDERWHHVSAQLPGGPLRVDPTVIAVAAAEAVAFVRRLIDEQIPPGIVVKRLRPGDYVLLDPFVEPAREVGAMPQSEVCPVCLQARHASGIG